MPELRHDAISGSTVIVAPERATRPHTVAPAPAEPDPVPADCPFCMANEAMTPPEVHRTGPGRPDDEGWRVRVVPNLYPIVGPTGDGISGAHEVVILSPDHHASFGRLDDEQAVEVLTVMRERVRHHLDAGAAYVSAFVNHGRAAGASIAHPHAQIVALDQVPPGVRARLDRFEAAEADLVARELAACEAAGQLLVEGDAPAWAPPAFATAYGLRVAPRAARSGFDEAPDTEIHAVALAVRDALARIDGALGSPAYNVTIHTAPPIERGAWFHWHCELVPRTTVIAGFELDTGIFVNPVAPEQGSARLRAAVDA
jgi:UDPglucose--hexose-1-phosphate uridylyltransferase